MKKNTVPVVDFREDPVPFLVMSYFTLGNLKDLHNESPVTLEEILENFV